MLLPRPVGPVSEAVVSLLRTGRANSAWSEADALGEMDVLHDHDAQLALATCYELHYGGFSDVDDRLEWSPDVSAVVTALEAALEDALRTIEPAVRVDGSDVTAALRQLVDEDDGPSLASYVLRTADLEQARDVIVQKSLYQLKEADPHTWALPRLTGRAKAAMVEIQSDEYGGGRVDAMHSELFRRTMRALGLDDSYGAYLDQALPETLAAVNTVTMFGLHRRLRGAVVGHLAALEMTSTQPSRRYANGLRRLGFGPEA
ncbi:MAG: iron-containing redox enzyme family protein, partial [Streptomycetaceae bacterium]|nr:iron-containing redox enzyme family protein [Streptomycetaceae bacterium]